MDNKAAIRIAKEYVADIFAEEQVRDIALEGISRDKHSVWEITIGFNRPMFQNLTGVGKALARSQDPFSIGPQRRSYKRVMIRDADGEVLGMAEAEFAQ
jgi:hypothetical protein